MRFYFPSSFLMIVGFACLHLTGCRQQETEPPGTNKSSADTSENKVLVVHSRLPIRTWPSELGPIEVSTIASGLELPWAVALLPDGRFLVTEKPGRMRLIGSDGRIGAPLQNVPTVYHAGQGGLLDVVLDPDFASNQMIWFTFSEPANDPVREGAHTAIAQARLHENALADVRVVFRQTPGYDGGHHYGSRLVFDRGGYLYATLGERNEYRDRAQALDNTVGKVIRLNRDGSIPSDNPFAAQSSTLANATPKANPAIWSYGHRNPQGAALNPSTGEVWIHEHGPKGGDEINIAQAGKNYGWDVVSHGTEYSGFSISDSPSAPGMQDPHYVWVPSIAPSGMAFMNSTQAGRWNGNLFVGALKFKLLVRLELRDGKIVHEERLLTEQDDRVRDVRAGSDGSLYVLTESKGELLRVRLAEQ